ncbi:hypothetical protein ABLE91_16745 [Aquabacter sp. CN5-332]|uniref:hypothetical protein n=1 Tax=Aquabacter sp. CN5-332 TaxID=3156608 RepID=UPI0032B55DCD
MPHHWNDGLHHVVALKGRASGTLATLKEAAEFLLMRFKDVTTNEALIYTMELLLLAAQSGTSDDIERATAQLESFLTTQRMR